MNEVEPEADMNDCIETVVNACAIFGDSVTRHACIIFGVSIPPAWKNKLKRKTK